MAFTVLLKLFKVVFCCRSLPWKLSWIVFRFKKAVWFFSGFDPWNFAEQEVGSALQPFSQVLERDELELLRHVTHRRRRRPDLQSGRYQRHYQRGMAESTDQVYIIWPVIKWSHDCGILYNLQNSTRTLKNRLHIDNFWKKIELSEEKANLFHWTALPLSLNLG